MPHVRTFRPGSTRLTKLRAGALATWTAILMGVSADAYSEGERLLGTGGVMEIEGAGGGGLTPWALISGLGTDRELGASAYCTYLKPQYFSLSSCGVAAGAYDRIELSYARQRFDLDDVAPGRSINENVFGVKARLFGDAVFDQDRWWPQVAVGLQYKQNEDFDFIPRLIGARHEDGTDLYLAATKVFLAGPFGRTWLVDATFRETRANQFGILGFGGDRSDSYRLEVEGSAALFLTDQLIAGAEYREKPNNLTAFREDNVYDGFVAFFPLKQVSVTVAYVNLGNVATHPGEQAWYLSVQATY
jgi:Protein of unknown function (DUF3034)